MRESRRKTGGVCRGCTLVSKFSLELSRKGDLLGAPVLARKRAWTLRLKHRIAN